MDRIYPDTLSQLIKQSKETDDAIYGNPLLYPECSNAVLNEHESNLDDLLKHSGIPTPWFWSRETLDATIKNQSLHRRLKVTFKHWPSGTIPWVSHAAYEYGRQFKFLPHHMVRFYYRMGNITPNAYKNLTIHNEFISSKQKLLLMNDKDNYMKLLPKNALYYHVEKAGSSSMGGTLAKYGEFNRTYLSENILTNTECGFSFVREPISRFISGYYTVNKLIFYHNKYAKKRYTIPDKFTFYNITTEPQRMTEFIKNLIEYKYDFLVSSPLEHMMTQSSILSVSQLDIHFIGRLKKFKKHFDLLREHCVNEYVDDFDEILSRMAGYGTSQLNDEPDYRNMMDLNDWEVGDLLPGYKVVADDYSLYQALVEYYRQDFICFGFEHDFKSFREKVYLKWQKTMTTREARKKNGLLSRSMM